MFIISQNIYQGTFVFRAPYTIKQKGKNPWTFENMFVMAKKASSDNNGDGRYDLGIDNFGLLAEGTLAFMLLEGTVERLIGKE